LLEIWLDTVESDEEQTGDMACEMSVRKLLG